MTAVSIIALLAAFVGIFVGLTGMSRSKLARQEAEDAWLRASEMKRELARQNWETEFAFNRFRAEQLEKQNVTSSAPYEITESCISCGACASECPEEAIKAGDIYVISPEKCKNHAACVEVCPTGSIVKMIYGSPFVTGFPESITPGTKADPNATPGPSSLN